MIEIKQKQNCCGCQACYNICPKGAIRMKEDEYGFKYPEVDREKCVECGLCDKVCPIINSKKIDKVQRYAYACINKNEDIRKQSSSGGIFTLLAQSILLKNGVIFGAAFDENNNVKHICVEKEEDLYKLRGSKYIQSDINKTYKQAEEKLKDGHVVLFTGTPCQIQGLKAFLNKQYAKLYTADIICHGVPSPKVWNRYKSEIEKNNNSQIEKVTFRDKSTGWHTYSFNAKFKSSDKFIEKFNNNNYMKVFLNDLSLRDSCYDCKFKGEKNRASDITLADFWGVEKVLPNMDDNKGTSLVIINSQAGENLFNMIKENIIYQKVDLTQAIKYNPSYNISAKKPKCREQFMDDINNMNFKNLSKKYIKKPNIFKRLIIKAKNVVRNIK